MSSDILRTKYRRRLQAHFFEVCVQQNGGSQKIEAFEDYRKSLDKQHSWLIPSRRAAILAEKKFADNGIRVRTLRTAILAEKQFADNDNTCSHADDQPRL